MKSTMTIYLVYDQTVTGEIFTVPSFLEFYGERFEEAIETRSGLIDWIESKRDSGEARRFLDEALGVYKSYKEVSDLYNIPDDTYKNKILPKILKKANEPVDWETYLDLQIENFHGGGSPALDFSDLSQEVLDELKIDFREDYYYVKLNIDIEKANKILKNTNRIFDSGALDSN